MIDNSVNKHVIFMNIADEISKFSKCVSKQVGCVIVRDGRIISSGCNGTPSGAVNCCELFHHTMMSNDDYRSVHHEFSESMECHAEENAIIIAAKYGVSINGSDLYVSMKPCQRCLKMIAGLGIKNIYYRREYDKCMTYHPNVIKMINDLNINLVKID